MKCRFSVAFPILQFLLYLAIFGNTCCPIGGGRVRGRRSLLNFVRGGRAPPQFMTTKHFSLLFLFTIYMHELLCYSAFDTNILHSKVIVSPKGLSQYYTLNPSPPSISHFVVASYASRYGCTKLLEFLPALVLFNYSIIWSKTYATRILMQGGNFHLKVGGAKSSGNAGDPMLGVAVSGGSRIYKGGGGGIK